MSSCRILIVALTTVLAALALSSPAQAAFGISSFGGSATDPSGARVSQAGAHPDLRTRITFPLRPGGQRTDGSVRNVDVALPPGLLGDPTKVPVCTDPQFYVDNVFCPVDTQVGTIALNLVGRTDVLALYRRPAQNGVAAKFATNYGGVIVTLDARVRVGDDGQYRVVVSGTDIPVSVPLSGVDVTLWGVPADPAHDAERVPPGNFATVGLAGPTASPARPTALTLAPTSCPAAALRTAMTASAWEDGVVHSAFFDNDFDGFPIRSEGCGRLAFGPSLDIAPSERKPDAPTGLNVDLKSPQNVTNPNGLANAHLRDVTVSLPEGMTVNPGSADGLQACSDGQLGLGNNSEASCPEASKLGTVTATTPVLDEPIEGTVHLRSQNSDDPESGELFRLALVLKNEARGILIKLPGQVRANAATGRLTASFKDNPQLPVENIKLAFKSGPRAPLATPADCGSKAIGTNLVSWAGHNVNLSNAFGVDCAPGLGGFSPALNAGTANPRGGVFSPLSLTATKPDGNTAVTGLRLDLPTGLLAKLKSNIGTQVGTVKTFAGPGANPFVLPGKVFLEGRYGDAPFSLRVVVPAIAGPFNLGEVVVRQKIYVNPKSAAVTVISDPLPTIVKGVPIRLQRLDVNVDKPGFIVNPTSCAAKKIGGLLSSAARQSVPINVRFQVSDCSRLALSPKLNLALSGKKELTDGKHPGLKAILTQKNGQANLKNVKVKLPLSLALDPDNAQGLCEFKDSLLVDPKCPKSSKVGVAKAYSPVLNQALTAPVYFAKNVRVNKFGRQVRTLPTLVVPLRGENGLKLNLLAKSSVSGGKLVNTFTTVPDAPVSYFKLQIYGGKNGILVANKSVCKASRVADVEIDGHNNKQADQARTINAPCPKAKKKSSKKSRR